MFASVFVVLTWFLTELSSAWSLCLGHMFTTLRGNQHTHRESLWCLFVFHSSQVAIPCSSLRLAGPQVPQHSRWGFHGTSAPQREEGRRGWFISCLLPVAFHLITHQALCGHHEKTPMQNSRGCVELEGGLATMFPLRPSIQRGSASQCGHISLPRSLHNMASLLVLSARLSRPRQLGKQKLTLLLLPLCMEDQWRLAP